jgi:hypothetical protein
MTVTNDVTRAAPVAAGSRDERPIFFIHIPKTGGNTVVSHFLAFLPVEEVFPPPPQLTLLDGDFAAARERLPRLRFLHGHVRVSLPHLLPLDGLRLLTFVRHPVRLVASHYLYFRHMPELPMHQAAKALGIAEFLRAYPSYGTNPQTRYLTQALGLRRGAGEFEPSEAARAVLDRFDFVGVTERMEDSLAALSEHYGMPCFPTARMNEGRASRDEVEAVEAVLRRDEFLLRLGADFTLRREAEERLERWLANRRAARLRGALLNGLAGTGPMPWVAARQEDAAATFLEGWHPQGWVGEPRAGSQYWWTADTARLLVASASGRPVRVALHVVETVGFDPARIRVTVAGRVVKTEATPAEPGVELAFRLDAEATRGEGWSAVVQLTGPRTATFAEIDPSTADHRRRSFAVRRISVTPETA